MRRGSTHDVIARSLGCDPALFRSALNRTFRIRACGLCPLPAATLGQLAEWQGVRPEARSLDWAVTARIEAVGRDIDLRGDAVSVVGAVKGLGMLVGIVSDCWYELPVLFPRMPLAALVDVAVFSYEIGHCKPHPAMYLAACDQLVVDPHECLYVGDGGGRELTGARGRGMAAVRLAAKDLVDHLTFDSEPDWRGETVRDLTEVLSLLTRAPP